ncbi:MAG: peptidase MA family metallohydrolase [Myxococcota bacterium]
MNELFLIFLIAGSDYRISSDHFQVESSPGLRRLSELVLKNAEEEYAEIQKMVPVSIKEKITIKIASNLSEYESLQPEGYRAPTWSVGIAYPKKGIIILRGDDTNGPDEILRTFRHELAHIFLHNFSKEKIPKWFSEGFSMYFEERGGLSRSLRLIRQAFSNSYIDIYTLEEGFPDNPVDIQNAYLTSSEFFSYLLSKIGEEGLFKVLELVKSGLDFRFAIYKVAGQTVSDIEKDFKKTTRFRYAWLPIITSSTTIWILLTMLFIYVFIVKKRKTETRLEIMRAEEDMLLLKRFEEDTKDEDSKRYLN